jgi:hypothetical protein
MPNVAHAHAEGPVDSGDRSVFGALATWAAATALSALAAVLCLHFTVSLLLGVAGAGRYEGAVGATMFFAVYATPITLIGGTPVALVLTGLWVVLAIRGVVPDASRRALALAALIGGATAPLLFWWIHGTEHMSEPYAGSTTLLLWTAASIGLLAPRLLSASLAPGRFTPRPAGVSTRD